jgi:hypothetical protein
MIYLLCQWDQNLCGTPTNTISLTGAGYAPANQSYQKQNDIQWKGVTDPTILIEFVNGQWSLDPLDDDPQYYSMPSEFPCFWHTLPTGTGPPPSVHYV